MNTNRIDETDAASTSGLIEIAVSIVGSQKKLAAELGVTQSLISQWATGKRRVGPRHCVKIERLTNGIVSRNRLRPEVFDESLIAA